MSGDQSPASAGGAEADWSKGTVIVTSLASDSHTWNLVFLQLLIEECGYRVVNLGPCVPDDLLVAQCHALDPDMVVISSVNGHGYQDGMRVIHQLRALAPLAATPIVIGGKLGTDEDGARRVAELTAAGFDAVFEDAHDPVTAFRGFLSAMQPNERLLETADGVRR
ncbi:cobalamin B12-binding domain-containing protein [Streptomyces alanosinicus]|uniref:Methylaspartate mutase n=1 Tax=Streptomyces alanosinicus TaxID=68171 RepID=A0A919D6D4_9ACTN|nr:cobalamin-dependent protein [Streptomyces alanosinicus]GHE14164.1 methylaspartate mutase [Streptomyces alanosinicus]